MSDDPFSASPDVRRTIEAATGLSGNDVERVINGLSEAGLAPSLRPNADSSARYAHALSLVRMHDRSVYGAAREAGLDPANFRRWLKRTNETIPNAEERHREAEERILTMSEELSEAAGQNSLRKSMQTASNRENS